MQCLGFTLNNELVNPNKASAEEIAKYTIRSTSRFHTKGNDNSNMKHLKL
jgi:hypothetical protein